MKKTTRIAALLAAAALIFGSLFFSCSDDPEEESSSAVSPTLPASVGDNPITKEIRLSEYADSTEVLVMEADGTAELLYKDKDDADADYETEYVYKYTWNAEKQEIYMNVEKYSEDFEKPMTYNEVLRDFDTLLMQSFEESYENYKNENWFKEDYPNVKSLNDYKQACAAEEGYKSFDEYFAAQKERSLEYLKTIFGAATTFGYKTNGGSMTLTEKFTGVKNLFQNSECYDNSDNDNDLWIGISSGLKYKGFRYDGKINTEKKTIVFTLRKNTGDEKAKSVINASYTEDLTAETVTVTLDDGTAIKCKFRGTTLTQRD
ncbi:MAG: hypothetical protein NC041_09985 [Bacteroides sp.]|nr:hypothetical protein [Prevotella sp.]MCM1408859.1 hypothetical protein [Treponema brennaborense]MCM1470781.1 hypothetical protein [Bacteroides sp.]